MPDLLLKAFHDFFHRKGKETEKAIWEKICIRYATGQKDNGVKDFFMKQLQLIGGDATVEAMKVYLNDKEMCDPALGCNSGIWRQNGRDSSGRISEKQGASMCCSGYEYSWQE